MKESDKVSQSVYDASSDEAKKRLCSKCYYAGSIYSAPFEPFSVEEHGCHQLLKPITSDGSDCPYFKEIK